MSGQRIEIEAELRAGDERPVDTVAALPDRRSIMKARREPRRSRRRVGRLLAAAALTGACAVAGLGLLVHTLRDAGLPASAPGAERERLGPQAQWLDWRARIAVAEDLKTPTTVAPPESESEPSTGVEQEFAAAPPPSPMPPEPVEAAPSATGPAPAEPAVTLALPEPPDPPRGEDFVETPSLAATMPREPDPPPAREASAPPAPEPPAVATGRVIAATQTPLPPRRPANLTTPQRQETATRGPDTEAGRTATRPVATRTRVFVHYSALDPAGRRRAEAIARSLAAAGFEVADLRERSVEIMTSNVRYYHPEDRGASSVVRDIVEARFPDLGIRGTALRDFAAYPTPPASGVVELWLASVSPVVEVQ